MRVTFLKLGFLAACVGAGSFFALCQARTNATLRADAERLRAEASEIESLRAERVRLAALQITAEELATLKAASQEVSRLRTEALALQQREEAANSSRENVSAASEPPSPAAEAWTNSGRATPLSAFHTGVWAVMHGETDALASSITFDAAGRAAVDALFARLPAETRVLHGSAEKVFATLIAAQLPLDLTSAEVIATPAATADATTLRLRLKRTEGSTKDANFHFERDAAGWRIRVPATAVEKYSASLKHGLPSRPDASSLGATPFRAEP